MAFNLTDCPFCTATFETAQERDRHAGKHGSSRQVVDMALNGIRISVGLVDATNGIYACPGVCSTRGSLGVIFLHVMQEHPTIFTNLKRMRDETDLPLDSKIMPPPSSSLEGQVTHVRAGDCRRRHGSGIRRYIPPNATIVPDLPTFATIALPTAPTLATLYRSTPPTFTYNAASAIEQHPDTDTLLDFIATSLSNLVHGCAFHGVMNHSTPFTHNKVYRCSEPRISSSNSEYKTIFTKALHGQPGTVCFRCWCPLIPSFENHPPGVCPKGTNQSNRNHWEDWFRVLPYLVFRVKALRELIFAELGIDETVFGNDVVVYAAWVTLSVGGDVNDDRITNLIVLTATYLHLRMSGRLSLPPGGFKLDDSVPVPN